MSTSSSTRIRRLYGEMTPEYVAKTAHRPVPSGYVLVESPARRGLVHLVRANSFKEVAVTVGRFGSIQTLCESAARETWTLVPRDPQGGQLVSCPRCRSRLSEALHGSDSAA
jgi:hypothetical protein